MSMPKHYASGNTGSDDVTCPAKTYVICKSGMLANHRLEKHWSACNGVEYFGYTDLQMLKVRKQHGELLTALPCCPRVILYRQRRDSALEIKLWALRSLGGDDDDRLILASVARALANSEFPGNFNIELIDWAPNDPHHMGYDARFEISIEVCGLYSELKRLKDAYKQFYKHFDKGAWK